MSPVRNHPPLPFSKQISENGLKYLSGGRDLTTRTYCFCRFCLCNFLFFFFFLLVTREEERHDGGDVDVVVVASSSSYVGLCVGSFIVFRIFHHCVHSSFQYGREWSFESI